jgi:predicted DCC family thiol-disulfide oxidoreductase YuxK
MPQGHATLYYDGDCALCNAEMARLREVKSDTLALVDIHSIASDGSLPNNDQLLRQLHLQTAQGDFIVGLEANISAWEHTPYAGRWRLLRLPLVRQLADVGYRVWARWRYRRLYHSPSS